jgi:hypothetical protein
MTKQEEQYIHFKACIHSLNKSLRILKIIKQQPENDLVGPAFEFALIEYSKPYTTSRGNFNHKNKLNEDYVPPEYSDLHNEILSSRDQIHAHSDLTIRDDILYVFEIHSKKIIGISSNIIDDTEKLSRIDEIISLIEKSLDLMYIEEQCMKSALPTSVLKN